MNRSLQKNNVISLSQYSFMMVIKKCTEFKISYSALIQNISRSIDFVFIFCTYSYTGCNIFDAHYYDLENGKIYKDS